MKVGCGFTCEDALDFLRLIIKGQITTRKWSEWTNLLIILRQNHTWTRTELTWSILVRNLSVTMSASARSWSTSSGSWTRHFQKLGSRSRANGMSARSAIPRSCEGEKHYHHRLSLLISLLLLSSSLLLILLLSLLLLYLSLSLLLSSSPSSTSTSSVLLLIWHLHQWQLLLAIMVPLIICFVIFWNILE